MDSEVEMISKKTSGRVTLTQMLKVLDKNVASGIEKKLKKLSKKKVLKAPLDKNKADQIERKAAYSDVTKEVDRWEDIVDQHRHAKHIKFPLDQQPDVLPSIAESVGELKPINEFEETVQNIIKSDQAIIRDNKTKNEEKYLKAISSDEAQERHRELQRMRVLLGSYAAKMRRQKGIKSKSYRRLLKRERIKSHVKKVEGNKDLLLEEIEKLQKLRARERASLKHKNTGKWAKHAKFRAKYDEDARQAMLEQIGIAEKLLEKPQVESDSESDSEDDISVKSDDEEMEAAEEVEKGEPVATGPVATDDQLIISTELINERLSKKRKSSEGDNGSSEDDDDEMDDDEEESQRKLMSEAFAGDDVVAEFRRAKDQVAGEEQPKDKDLFLPGWGDWAGPGIKINKRKRNKYIIKAKKLPRRDDNLGNVIISEKADDRIKDKMVKKLPRGFKRGEQLTKLLIQPTDATFTSQTSHREAVRPRVATKMGARIEPMSDKMLKTNRKAAKWAV